MGPLLVASSFILFPATFIASLHATYRWHGVWRKLAALPLVAVAAYFAIVLIPAWMKDPTSHNLFPFELGIYLSPTIPFMAIVFWRHRVAEAVAPVRGLQCRACGKISGPGPATCSCGAPLKAAIRLR